MILYCDLDEVLVSPIRAKADRHGLVPVVPRPGAERFFSDLSKHGPVVLLSSAARLHVDNALRILGPGVTRYLRGIYTREDLAGIAEQIDVVDHAPIPTQEKLALYESIPPILEPGYMFDDFPVGSWMYALKGIATATPPERWIQVEAFEYPAPDRGGLRKAYTEFLKRESAYKASLSGTRIRRKGA